MNAWCNLTLRKKSHREVLSWLKQWDDTVIRRLPDKLPEQRVMHHCCIAHVTVKLNCQVALLWGPPGVGKCLARDTPIMMFDGNVKLVQEIAIGDVLMGDDSKPRHVLALGRGREKMFRISPTKGASYTVNHSHILSLCSAHAVNGKREFIDVELSEYLKQPEQWRRSWCGYRVAVQFSGKLWTAEQAYQLGVAVANDPTALLPPSAKTEEMQTRLALLAGLIDSTGRLQCSRFLVSFANETLANEVLFVARSCGFGSYIRAQLSDRVEIEIEGDIERIPTLGERENIDKRERDALVVEINVTALDEDDYFGFELDSNGRFLLGDFTVTHNTTMAHTLAVQAGYRAMEINASDERTKSTLIDQVVKATHMKSVFGADARPNCLIIDEIDGVDDKQVVPALLKLLYPKKETAKPLARPIICICNNRYASSLRALTDAAKVVHVAPPRAEVLLKRLQTICDAESLVVDPGSLKELCALNQNDIRACLNTLQYMQHGSSGSLASKDTTVNPFDLWKKIFTEPSPGRDAHDAIWQLSGLFAHDSKLLSGCFENFLRLGNRDDYLNKVRIVLCSAHSCFVPCVFGAFAALPLCLVCCADRFTGWQCAGVVHLRRCDSEANLRASGLRFAEIRFCCCVRDSQAFARLARWEAAAVSATRLGSERGACEEQDDRAIVSSWPSIKSEKQREGIKCSTCNRSDRTILHHGDGIHHGASR